MAGSLCGMTEQEDEAEMRVFLLKKGLTVPATATYVEVLSLFEKTEVEEYDFFEDDIRAVKYPVLPTSALHPSETDFERIKQASVHEMESIIARVHTGERLCKQSLRHALDKGTQTYLGQPSLLPHMVPTLVSFFRTKFWHP